MTAQLLDGEPVAGRIKMELADRAQRLTRAGRTRWARHDPRR